MTQRLLFDRRLLAISVLAGLAVRLWVAWQPVDVLSWRATADDAYYYFKLAQHIGAGAGTTFDGINQTNGFHPLYALLLVPIFRYVGDDIALGVHLALTLIALVSVVTAWPIYLIGKSVHSSLAGAIGAMIHLLNPWVIILTMTGVESAVYVFCFAWTVMAYVRWKTSLQSFRGIVPVGLLSGLTIMARSEGIMLLVGIIFDLIVEHWRRSGSMLMLIVLVGGLSFVVCFPWMFWSISLFGTPFQISSSAIMLHNYANVPKDVFEAVKWYLGRISWFIPRYLYKLILFNFTAVVGLAIFYFPGFRLKLNFFSLNRLFFLFITISAISVYYNTILLHQQHWYFNALVLIFTLLGFVVISDGLSRIKSESLLHRYRKSFSLLVLFVLCVFFVINWQRGLYPGQKFAYENGIHIAGSYLRGERLGATDSGIVGFFCRCVMVNLDGVMNNAAVEYYRTYGYNRESIFRFALSQDVSYIWSGEPFTSSEVRTVRRVQFLNGVWYQIEKAENSTGYSDD
jgi:hypothetical protein